MKKIRFFLAIMSLISLVFTSCSTNKAITNRNQIDERLVGVWQGSEKDQQISGMEKKWEVNRKKNGTFSLIFTTIYEGETDKFIEKGKWWVDGNTFFEYHNISGETDTYKFTVLNDEQVKFEMTNTNIDFAELNYSFIDTKISHSNSKKVIRDGLSLETAIKVKSVSEEYAFIRKNCQNCQLLGQSLINHKGKFFDEITVINSDGKEISYYFDINSFFGKMW